ncbi:MAG: hypothetical protein A2269_05800 [Lentisphaerae bacterium RIFOXYA12_FULL_60_10]|nr:MAG: hypothetical protein A2269_05800 [Lentisphaerae bacterium RIFOXYA12_FULL_60_10]
MTSSPRQLAIDGGTPVRTTPMPPRRLLGAAEKAAAMQVFDDSITSGEAFLYNGPYEKRYEQDFVAFMGGGYADGVNSGTNAVFCALGALDLNALSEVIVPPITDPGGVMPVIFNACVPVVADSDPRSYNLCAETIAPLINARTRAIIVAHIAGEPADMDPILELARRHNLYVVEDCAQSHGARYKGRLVGSMGDIAAFSTMAGKHHCTGGQGGVVYTRNETLHMQGRRFADRGKPFGIVHATGNVRAGINSNLNDLSAAIGSASLKRLPDIIARRRQVGERIKAGLAQSKAVFMGWQPPETECVYWFLRLGVRLERLRVDKARFCAALAAEGIPVNPSYRHIPCEAPWFREQKTFGSSGFPWTAPDYQGPRKPVFQVDNAIRVTDTHFNINVNEQYTDREVDDILSAIRKVEHAFQT